MLYTYFPINRHMATANHSTATRRPRALAARARPPAGRLHPWRTVPLPVSVSLITKTLPSVHRPQNKLQLERDGSKPPEVPRIYGAARRSEGHGPRARTQLPRARGRPVAEYRRPICVAGTFSSSSSQRVYDPPPEIMPIRGEHWQRTALDTRCKLQRRSILAILDV